MIVLRLIVFALLLVPGSALACGVDSDCLIGERYYRIAMPAGHTAGEPVGAIVFAHGYRGRADRAIRNPGLRGLADELGVALIAAKSSGDDWAIANAPSPNKVEGADELAYFDALVEDAARRFPIDRNKLLVTGFSAGGMMVWTLACERGDLFAGFAPLAGTFWRPVPDACAGAPVNLFHYHGTQDRIVPLGGRPIADTHQGDVRRAVDMLARTGSYTAPRPIEAGADLDCVRRESGSPGNRGSKIFDYCLFEGGHEFRSAFIRRAWTELQAIGAM
ncbi:MAG: PHB depolymerase family esterase [Pseudomonadota bacterium]